MKKYLPPIQFTKLTRGDMAMHKYCYTSLLLEETKCPLVGERGKELCKSMQRFYEAFK